MSLGMRHSHKVDNTHKGILVQHHSAEALQHHTAVAYLQFNQPGIKFCLLWMKDCVK